MLTGAEPEPIAGVPASIDSAFRMLDVGRVAVVPKHGLDVDVVIADVDEGTSHSRRIAGTWNATHFGGSRYVVLESFVQGAAAFATGLANGSHAIIDTSDSWVGYPYPITAGN